MNAMTHSKRILIVEDSLTQARELQLILESEGYQADIAPDGNEGYERFCSVPYDLVISDVNMPGISGYELCKKIKANNQSVDVPVVLLTSLNELKDLVEGLRCGSDNFITKPYEHAYLIGQVRKILNNKQVPAPTVCDPQSGICLMDNKFVMNLDRKRCLDYLVSTFDDFLRSKQSECQSKLTEANQRMQMLNMREEFIAALSHDLKNPLIAGERICDVLLERTHLPEQTRLISILQESHRTMLSMIHNLLDVYRFEETGYNICCEETNVVTVINACID